MNDDPDDFELDDTPRLARQDVPWVRRGCPDAPDIHSTKWGPHVLNIGLKSHRLVSDEKIIKSGYCSLGVEERAFAMMWDYYNNGHQGQPIWSILEGIRERIKSDEDVILVQYVAQAIIQWLGTNCGAAFVNQARRYAEHDQQRLESIVDPDHLIKMAKLEATLKNRKERLEYVNDRARIKSKIYALIKRYRKRVQLQREQYASINSAGVLGARVVM